LIEKISQSSIDNQQSFFPHSFLSPFPRAFFAKPK